MLRSEMERNTMHGVVDATYTVFSDPQGQPYLQIDTYGSKDRAIPGKKSQSLQFGPQGIAELRQILASL
jgi:hypothetical protein